MLKDGQGKWALTLLSADYTSLRWNKGSIKTGFKRFWQQNFESIGEFITSTQKECNSMTLDSKELGYLGVNEEKIKEKGIREYKADYQK
jgi:hypothetical protein